MLPSSRGGGQQHHTDAFPLQFHHVFELSRLASVVFTLSATSFPLPMLTDDGGSCPSASNTERKRHTDLSPENRCPREGHSTRVASLSNSIAPGHSCPSLAPRHHLHGVLEAGHP